MDENLIRKFEEIENTQSLNKLDNFASDEPIVFKMQSIKSEETILLKSQKNVTIKRRINTIKPRQWEASA